MHSVALTNGSGFAVYEVLTVNPSAIESIEVPVSVSWPGSVPPSGTGEVAVDYAPLSAVVAANQEAAEPRFIDRNQFEALLTVGACETTEPPPPTQGAPTLTKASGDNQVVAGGEPVPQPLVVRLTQGGQPAAGRSLSVSVPAPGSQYVG
jgi:hypothetical protein